MLRLGISGDPLPRHDLALGSNDRVLTASNENLKPNRDELEQAEKPCDYTEALGPPLGGRLFLFLGLFFGGFLVSLRGWLDLYNERRLIRAACFGSGLLLGGCGLGLWLVTLESLGTLGWLL
jgi:hypothetical protein